jgi:hypothetical protein
MTRVLLAIAVAVPAVPGGSIQPAPQKGFQDEGATGAAGGAGARR